MTGPFFSSGRIGVLLLLLLLAFSFPAFAWTGKVTGVADGDTGSPQKTENKAR